MKHMRHVKLNYALPAFGQLKRSFGDVPPECFKNVAFSPNGRTIATSGGSKTNWYEGQVKLSDVQIGQLLKIAKHGNRSSSVAPSPDGTKVVEGNFDGIVRMYSVSNFTLIA